MPAIELSMIASRSCSEVRSCSCDTLMACTSARSAASRVCACSLKRRATFTRSASAKDSSTISSAEPYTTALAVSALDGSTPMLCSTSTSTPSSRTVHAITKLRAPGWSLRMPIAPAAISVTTPAITSA